MEMQEYHYGLCFIGLVFLLSMVGIGCFIIDILCPTKVNYQTKTIIPNQQHNNYHYKPETSWIDEEDTRNPLFIDDVVFNYFEDDGV